MYHWALDHPSVLSQVAEKGNDPYTRPRYNWRHSANAAAVIATRPLMPYMLNAWRGTMELRFLKRLAGISWSHRERRQQRCRAGWVLFGVTWPDVARCF